MGIGVLRGGINVLTQATRKLAATPWYLAGGVALANCVGAYQAKGAASLAASRVNLANPGTYDLTNGVAPTWASATGWTFNGTTQYLDTGIVPATSYSAIARFSNATLNSDRSILGMRVDVSVATIFGLWSYSGVYSGYANRNSSYILPNSSGVYALAQWQGYYNGSPSGSPITPGTYPGTPISIWVGSSNRGTGALWPYGGDIQAVAIYNATLSAAQVLAISTSMAAL